MTTATKTRLTTALTFKLLERELFTIHSQNNLDRVNRLFDVLIRSVTATEEVDWTLGECGHATLDSLIVGAFWFYSEWYDGQASKEYELRCMLGGIYSPGMSSGPEKQSSEYDVYKALLVIVGQASWDDEDTEGDE